MGLIPHTVPHRDGFLHILRHILELVDLQTMYVVITKHKKGGLKVYARLCLWHSGAECLLPRPGTCNVSCNGATMKFTTCEVVRVILLYS